LKGKTPNKKEKKWLDAICQLGCIVCRNEGQLGSPAEPHHIIDGMGSKKNHMRTIPLCPKHHRTGEDNFLWVSRHPFKKAFEERYGSEEKLLKQTEGMVDA
jgi:hypothetical protein